MRPLRDGYLAKRLAIVCALGGAMALGACAGAPASNLLTASTDQGAGLSFLFGSPVSLEQRKYDQEQAIIARAILEHESRHP